MSERSDNREWLERGATRHPTGWEATFIERFGLEGALDLLAIQAGDVFDADLRRRPFARNPELKELIYTAREAISAMTHSAYQVGFDEVVND